MTTRAAHIDELDREYLALVAEAAHPPRPFDHAAVARRQALVQLVADAGRRLADAITDHDLTAYGDPYPEEPCTAANPQP